MLLRGRVVDEAGAPLAGAHLELAGETGRETGTNPERGDLVDVVLHQESAGPASRRLAATDACMFASSKLSLDSARRDDLSEAEGSGAPLP